MFNSTLAELDLRCLDNSILFFYCIEGALDTELIIDNLWPQKIQQQQDIVFNNAFDYFAGSM